MAIIRLQGQAEAQRGIHYEVDAAQEPIGVGGMGQVFKGICVDERNGSTRPVAIKFLFSDLPPQALERARREASIQLHNDNLIEMLGFIETDEQTPNGVVKHCHVVSELLDGVSLDGVLEGRTQGRDGREIPFAVKMLQDYRNDPEHFAQKIVMNVLSGLMALHDAGYIHRDIDPSNIMLTSEGRIKLIDFGIAKQMNNLTTSDKQLTVAGKFMGKPEYAAPELALGDLKHQNQTTDIYAMGVLLYQCIVGHVPFEGPRHEVLEKQIRGKMNLGVIKNKALRNIIAVACEKKQELRYQSSAQMRVALETMSGSKRAMSNKQKGIIAVAAAAVVLVLCGIFFTVKSKNDAAREEAQRVAEAAAFEQAKGAFEQRIRGMITDAGAIVRNVDKDADGFEQTYMKAVTAYSDIEKVLSADTLYHLSFAEVSAGKKQYIDSLRATVSLFEQKIQELVEADLDDADSTMTKPFYARIAKIQEFISKNK